VAQRLVASSTQVLVEGPLPTPVKDVIGIRPGPRALAPAAEVTVHSDDFAHVLACYGCRAGGRVSGAPVESTIRRDPELDWSMMARVPISTTQAAAWRHPGWEVEYVETDSAETEVLAWITPHEPRTGRAPLLVRCGSLWALNASLLAFLSRAQSAPPQDGAGQPSEGRVVGIEALVLGTIDAMYRAAGRRRVRVRPWPPGVEWVLTVRHDFDRFLNETQTREVLAMHARAGTAGTWYFRSEPRSEAARPPRASIDLRSARAVHSAPRQEVALHTELVWQRAEEEQGVVETAIGARVRGSSAHGSPYCFRYQGAPNVLWAESRGMDYTEMLGASQMHPHRFLTLQPDGVVVPLAVICLPNHISLDTGTGPDAVRSDYIRRSARDFIALHGVLQVMNHPDIHITHLEQLIADLPREGRADWTSAAIVDWWRRTHVAENLAITDEGGESVTVSSRVGVENLEIEILESTGELTTHSVTLPPGERVSFTGPPM
jgi:hypothetical protein